MTPSYFIPPSTFNVEGAKRRVGFELEFSGLQIAETAALVAEAFPGKVETVSEVEMTVVSGEFGQFTVELDWQLGKEIAAMRKSQYLPGGQNSGVGNDLLMSWVTWLAQQLVPVEVVCPPMTIDTLHHLDTMVELLRKAGARGTDESVLYAFGVHINPEIPDSSASTISRYLQAFGVAQEWLVEVHRVDPMRRLMPYVDLYPDEYLDHLLAYDMDIPLHRLMNEYLEYNGTRNRALDMLPLWMHLQPSLVRKMMDDPLLKGRPTLHYRLPNCEIEKSGWQLSESWNIWCVVEYLAANEYELKDLLEHWHDAQNNGVFGSDTTWHDELERIYHDLKSG